MDQTYAEVGAEVILGKGRGWVPGMERFTGKKATITGFWGSENRHCIVDLDNGAYVWCVQAMYLATDEPLLRK